MLIVDAARDVIAQRGLVAASLRDIAHAAGVSVGTVSYHFTGVADLLRALLDREMALFYEPLVDKARDTENGLEALRVLVDGFFADDARTVVHWRMWLDFWSVSAHDEQYAQWQQRTYLRWRADVAQMFATAHKQGDVHTDDLAATVSDFLVMFDGAAVHAYLPRSPLGPDDARRQLFGWLARLTPDGPAPRTARRSTRRQ